MRKILMVVFLGICVVWQGIAVANTVPDIDQLIHAASHGGLPHHHEADGSMHFDDSDESLDHMQADYPGSGPNAIAEDARTIAPMTWRAFALVPAPAPPPNPFLEGPDRPPRVVS